MSKKGTNILSDLRVDLAEDATFTEELIQKSKEICKQLKICEKCGRNLGKCVHSDYSIN